MKTIFAAVAIATLSFAMQAQAQTVAPQEGDYYAPRNTIVQQPTPQELNGVNEGDYYAPSKTIVQPPTPSELSRARQGDYYTPTNN